MAELKTFVFTDIAGSVQLKNEMPGRSTTERDQAFIQDVLTPHRERIERQLAEHSGRVVSTAGDGHFLVFGDTILAARWAVSIQEGHSSQPITTSAGTQVQCRISIHVGIPQIDPQDPTNFVGKPVDYAARLNDYAKADQILASRSVVAILEDAGMDGIDFHSHGKLELKGIGRVEVHELLFGDRRPQPTRHQPAEKFARQWSVVPSSMGLTEFFTSSGSPVASAPQTVASKAAALKQVGNYQLEGLLGSGGMGDVYMARHTQFGRVRAVKVIKQHFVDSGHEEIIQRFYQEIKAVGRLEHPNIVVAIESSAPEDSVHFLVMEYIDGLSVEQQIAAHGPLRISDACEIARQAAGGLQYIHQHNMVHRDVKPSNLMLSTSSHLGSSLSASSLDQTDAGRAVVKILDLGLALLATDDSERLTRFDARAMGTGMYMAPEQWQTTSVDVRADIYSLGCALYHMLSGQPPFVDSELLPRIAHAKSKLPKIRRVDVSVPTKLWAVLQRMVAKDPEDRYATPAEVAAALAPFCEGHDLAALVREHRESAAAQSSFSDVKLANGADTQGQASPHSETQPGLPGKSWGRGNLVGPQPMSRRMRWLRLAGTGFGLALVVWLAIMAGRRSGSSQSTRAERLESLQFAATTGAKNIARDISQRMTILSNRATRGDLRRTVNQLSQASQRNASTAESQEAAQEAIDAAWDTLKDWIAQRREDSLENVSSESWFLTNDVGQQIARHPTSKSVGKFYAHRDYFHGQGPDATGELGPLDHAHQSDVYRSSSSGHLKVAFSVPVWSGKIHISDRKVIGVLAMSLDLGNFNALEDELPPGHRYEVLLIDIGDYSIDGESGEGLVLHHHGGPAFGKKDPLPVLQPGTLALIRQALDQSDNESESSFTTLDDYRDPQVTGSKPYLGAICRVDSFLPPDHAEPTNWLVLVQEPAER